jgi:hypothetical protein
VQTSLPFECLSAKSRILHSKYHILALERRLYGVIHASKEYFIILHSRLVTQRKLIFIKICQSPVIIKIYCNSFPEFSSAFSVSSAVQLLLAQDVKPENDPSIRREGGMRGLFRTPSVSPDPS